MDRRKSIKEQELPDYSGLRCFKCGKESDLGTTLYRVGAFGWSCNEHVPDPTSVPNETHVPIAKRRTYSQF